MKTRIYATPAVKGLQVVKARFYYDLLGETISQSHTYRPPPPPPSPTSPDPIQYYNRVTPSTGQCAQNE